MSETLLKVSGLTMRFGGLLAVDSVAFEVRRDEVFAIIGPNGAGKTTVFNCVGGFYKPTAGEIVMDGKPITGMPSHKGGAPWPGAHVPERAAVQAADGAGETCWWRSTPRSRRACCRACSS
ncbi:leucine/isoleucine/valine transporter ATP-binding subunit [Bordetella pertussis]|nr:leucine/isoleucine/valine transporter ATP-binding subunit [Bordetella pertussis]